MSDMIKLTGLWKQEGKNGGYLSGTISPTSKLLILPNTFKKKDSEPDYVAYMTPGKDRQEAENKPGKPSRGLGF